MRYALKGTASGELWTYRGAVVVHDNRAELEYLFAKSLEEGRYSIVELPRTDLGIPTLGVARHPDMSDVEWPLNRADFLDLERK